MTGSRACAFCGGSGLTREHVWPRWLNALPEVHGDDPTPHVRRPHVVLGMTRDPVTGFPIHHPETRGVEQPPWDLQVRVVCGKCNSGWMADRESRIKPLLQRFFRVDRSCKLGRKELTHLAAWAVKTAMMFEFCQPLGVAFSDIQRSRVMSTERPPGGVEVFMARYVENQYMVLRHYGGELQYLLPDGRLSDPFASRGLTLLIPRNVAFLVTSVAPASEVRALNEVSPLTQDPATPWRRIWPGTPESLAWPEDLGKVDDREVLRLSIGVENTSAPGGRYYAPPAP
jgi:hypothetical protein